MVFGVLMRGLVCLGLGGAGVCSASCGALGPRAQDFVRRSGTKLIIQKISTLTVRNSTKFVGSNVAFKNVTYL
jgi:hypothetical protein